MMRGLLEYVSQQMMTNKNWTFQLSALEILAMIVRMKLPTLSGCILNQYLDMALDVSFNSPTAIVKLGALSLLRVLLLTFPAGTLPKLAESQHSFMSLGTLTDVRRPRSRDSHGV